MSSNKCFHKWAEVDKDDSFKKAGDIEYKRVKEECVKCSRERVRRIKRRLK